MTLINNALPYLCDEITYKLTDKTIEAISHPGQATAMLGLLTHSRGFSKTHGLNQLWCKDTDDDLTNTNQGYEIRQEYITKPGKGYSHLPIH